MTKNEKVQDARNDKPYFYSMKKGLYIFNIQEYGIFRRDNTAKYCNIGAQIIITPLHVNMYKPV